MTSQTQAKPANRFPVAGMQAFIAAAGRLEESAPSWCVGWGAREVVAHVTAAAQERAELIEEHLAGKPSRATRPWREREAPLRELHWPVLLGRLRQQANRFQRALLALEPDDAVVYTGWRMSAERLAMHAHSEAVLHRWDLVGADQTGRALLSESGMVGHALAVFSAIRMLDEARRWVDRAESMPLTFRVDGRPSVTTVPGRGLVVGELDNRGPVIDLEPYELPLVLWGRVPARLRDPSKNAETIDAVLRRIVG